jgi:hypothetical protein
MAQGGAGLAQMFERMPEDDGRPLSRALVEVEEFHLPHIYAGERRLASSLEANSDSPPGYERLQ